MNTNLKQKWITALRSGNYKQGFGALRRTDDTFCCLGVLCDVAGVLWRPAESLTYLDGMCWAESEGDKNCTHLPKSLEKQVPLPVQQTLTDMNDQGSSFTEIADYIEQNL